MPLSNAKIVKLKPRRRAYKESDEKGLYLYITPSGGKLWRLKYRFGGKEKVLSFGKYPEVTLKQARDKRDEAKSTLAKGIDPGELKQQQKRARVGLSGSSFEVVTREWVAKFSTNWSPVYSERLISRFERNVFPWIGSHDCNDITPPVLLSVLRRIEHRGALETAHRTKQSCGQVFRYAIATGRCERDPSADLKGALPPAKKTHFATITDAKGIGTLLRAIDIYQGHHPTRCALKLAPLLFVRPGELRHAEWSEINFEESEWRIPAEKMKMKTLHIVPLSTQAVTVFQDLHPLTGNGKYVFPSIRSSQRAMSENTVNAALRRLGYEKTEMTGHGFRAMASTLLNEQGWNKDAIERQLAHSERDTVRASYNYAEYLPERKKMMQEWADYLDKLKAGAEVIPINTTV